MAATRKSIWQHTERLTNTTHRRLQLLLISGEVRDLVGMGQDSKKLLFRFNPNKAVTSAKKRDKTLKTYSKIKSAEEIKIVFSISIKQQKLHI